jgi:hypothetical protein
MSVQTLDEVMRKAKKISHEQTRRESEDYLEMVMYQNTWPDIERLFRDYFGAAVKPAGEEVEEESEYISNPHGGLSKEQTLFYSERDSMVQLAMIWPWSDGKRMTVKIIQECE